MNLTDNNNIVKKLEKDDRLDFDAILEKGKHFLVKSKIVCIIWYYNSFYKYLKDSSSTCFIIHLRIGIGLFGPWQMKMVALLFLVSMANGITVFVYTFTG